MKRIFVFCVITLAFAACNKDKVESTPHLTFKSFNSNVIHATDDQLLATLEFTDQEGDLDSLFITRERLNLRGPSYLDFPYSGIPSFGNQNRGELAVTLPVQNNLLFNLLPIKIPGSVPEQYEPDTLLLRFYIKDKAGHVSDTTSPKQLIVIR
jgi:hypothetical protein